MATDQTPDPSTWVKVSGGSPDYHTQLVFSTLSSSMDSSNYECSVTINSNDSLLYVEDSTLVNESTTVSVQGMNIHAFMYVCMYTLVYLFYSIA